MAEDECAFCNIERKLEQDAISFSLGSSYMEEDIRDMTDKEGFCRHHYKMMFDYGNQLGNALMLETHIKKVKETLKKQMEDFSPSKASFVKRMKKTQIQQENKKTSIGQWVREFESSCYVCNYFESSYNRYLDTFFEMLEKDSEFYEMVKESRGFCIHHFGDIIEASNDKLKDSFKEKFYPMIYELMDHNMERILEDVSWFVEKYDYRNRDKEWKNSKDAIPRAMQKLKGGYPADPVFMENR